MKSPLYRRFSLYLAISFVFAVISTGAYFTAPPAAAARRPMELADILAWKNITPATSVVSNDGRWFAYRLTPLEGDSEVIVRETNGDKEYRFGVGEVRPQSGGGGAAGGPGAASAAIGFSDDARWVAFSIAPTRKEAAQLRKQRRPIQNKVALLNLADGKEVRFDKVRRFAFSGENPAWIALQKYGPEASGGGGAAAAAAPSATGAAARADDRAKGSDLILHDLKTGNDLNIGNVSEFGFDKAGKWLALTIDAQDKSGNGIVVRNMETGVVTPLDSAAASYERLTWTEKGDGLAVLKGTDDKHYKDKVYSLRAFTGFADGKITAILWDPWGDKTFPADMGISPNRSPQWTEDLSALSFGIRTLKKADAKPEPAAGAKTDVVADVRPGAPAQADDASDEEKPDLILWHWQDPRLQSEQQVQEDRDKNFSYLCIYRVKENKFIRLADDTVRTVTLAPKDRYAVGTDVREYELEGSLTGREFEDVYTFDLQTGARKLALKKMHYYFGPSTDGTRLLYFDDGQYFTYDIASGQSVNLTRTVPTSFVDVEDDHNQVKPPVTPIGWTKGGDAVLLSDGWDIWKVPMTGNAENLTVNGKKDGIRYRQVLRIDADERGPDLSVPRYVQMFGEFSKKGGIGLLEPGKAGVQPLLWEDAAFSRFLKAKKADTYLYTRETYKQPADYYATDASLKNGRKITSLDKQVDAFNWSSGSEIVNYTVTLGKGGPTRKLQGSLFLPANYEKGKSYPTIVYIYEKLSQSYNTFYTPTANGFNKSAYTSNGYAVLMPDITYRLNDPGVSAVACITAALKAAIATGVVDAQHVGLQGHSWGGYQTAFTVTQTKMFAAAVAGAPLTNMVSMYSLIYKNSGGANQAIFESSQGRFLGGYWDNWEAYFRNSPVNFAKNVTTPLIILHNDKDGAVDFTQGVEYYNTLRRLGKKVVMLEYPGENHGLAKPANQQDYTVRMKEFFDHYLMGQAAPDWWTNGVSRLEMEDHIKQRLEMLKKAKPTTPPTKPTTDHQ